MTMTENETKPTRKEIRLQRETEQSKTADASTTHLPSLDTAPTTGGLPAITKKATGEGNAENGFLFKDDADSHRVTSTRPLSVEDAAKKQAEMAEYEASLHEITEQEQRIDELFGGMNARKAEKEAKEAAQAERKKRSRKKCLRAKHVGISFVGIAIVLIAAAMIIEIFWQ